MCQYMRSLIVIDILLLQVTFDKSLLCLNSVMLEVYIAHYIALR